MPSKQYHATHKVDVVSVAVSAAGREEGVEPVKALASVRAGRDSGEGLLDGERVDVLLVPGRRLARRNAVDVGLVEREDGWKGLLGY